MTRYLAIDPGGTTGWATYDEAHQPNWKTGLLGPGNHHNALWGLLCEVRADVVIYERFLYQRREIDKGVSLVLDSVEYIGVIKFWYQQAMAGQFDQVAHNHHVDPILDGELIDYRPALVVQSPSQGACKDKNLWTPDKLKRTGLWTNATHTRDATTHLLYYLTIKGDRRWIEMTKS